MRKKLKRRWPSAFLPHLSFENCTTEEISDMGEREKEAAAHIKMTRSLFSLKVIIL